jgi:hypothetical protein
MINPALEACKRLLGETPGFLQIALQLVGVLLDQTPPMNDRAENHAERNVAIVVDTAKLPPAFRAKRFGSTRQGRVAAPRQDPLRLDGIHDKQTQHGLAHHI